MTPLTRFGPDGNDQPRTGPLMTLIAGVILVMMFAVGLWLLLYY